MKAKKAAGAMDEMEKEIKDNPWDKSEGAEVLYPSPQTTLHVGDITTTAHSGIVAKHAEGAWSNGHLHKR
jgi:hypothetical protein